MQVFCDFDGTISVADSTDHVLRHLADPAWEALEDDWVAGRIDAAACMRGQVALIGGSDAELDAVLSAVTLDPGFAAFADWCATAGVPLTIVSDGVDRFIRAILAREGLAHLPVISNRLAGEAGARRLEQPHRREGCGAGSGVCKCEATARLTAPDQAVVYIGDGRSDFCVSGRADILFAKAALADYAAGRARPYHSFRTFHDITTTLSALKGDRRVTAS
ncbi:MtnX-like HAD-IB family phosphatase [Phenylobacterium aquaticum]|uniref:MtnX-like HAD-IB family phosphatase n=1 Tax=Phenylobacterium aquaticum TaxID=1763816 RepID=UPI001F5E21E5|nr:MtnX-like HAD-IB family phosphatase [Phenylobacterium aquaticum]MCI3135168.1 MtnX-like HAD-IB family phosphatase [Phenylobacterium aquaticum]